MSQELSDHRPASDAEEPAAGRTDPTAGPKTSADNSGEPVARAEKPAAPALPGDATCLSAYRAVRVLHILERRTGEGKGVAMPDIIEELEHPVDEAFPPVKASKKTVFSAVSALRAAGHAIEYRRATGYHLLTRKLPDEEIVRLLAMIDRNRTVPAETKRSMSLHLARLASADIIEHLEVDDGEKPKTAAPRKRVPRREIDARELLEQARGQAMPVVFDILPLPPAADTRRERCALQPIDIREQGGRAYLLGTVVAGGAENALRTVALDRMRNIECRLLDGSKLMAALDDPGDAAQVA